MGKYVTLTDLENGLNHVIDSVKGEAYANIEQMSQVAAKVDVIEDKATVLERNLLKLDSDVDGKADKATSLAGYNIADAYTKTEVDNAIAESQATAVRPGGSLTAAEVVSSLLVAANEGKVYNLSETITTTTDFVDGAGLVIPAGANIWVIDTSTTDTPSYKFDVYAAAYGVATSSANGLMSATDKEKLDNADVTAYTGDGTVVTVSNHQISVVAASPSASGVGGNAGTMSAADKEKLDGMVQATSAEVEAMIARLHSL